MEIKKKWLSFFIAILLFISNSLSVFANDYEYETQQPDTTLSPYFFVEGTQSMVESFPLKETKVTTNISGVFAETYVVQTYVNEGATPINANYLFPTSSKASVHGMKMTIGDTVITAKIKEKVEAKEIFEEAKSEGKSAALLEQERPNVFNMNVANVMPGETIVIELHFSELIVSKDGVYQYVFPTVVGPRYNSNVNENESNTESDNENTYENNIISTSYLKEGKTPPVKYDITVNLSTGVPIKDLVSNSHKINIDWKNESNAQVNLSNPEQYAGNKDYILDYKLTGDTFQNGLILNKGEEENFFMMMVQPPERFTPDEIPPREYVFVLDVSGSMSGIPIDIAKELIKDLIWNLKETDSFNVILFSGASVTLAETSLPANAENINKAIVFINNEEGGGGTELAEALKSYIDIPKIENVSRSFIVITDGYIDGEAEIFNLINNNISTTNFFSFGIGESVNRYLIDGIAKAGLGESFVITNPIDAKTTAERFRNYVQSPLLTDITISYDGFETYDVEPKKVPTLFAQRPIVLFGKWKGEQTGTITINGKSGTKDYTHVINVSEIPVQQSTSAISYLWARTRIERITDYGMKSEEAKGIQKQVASLGLKYNMMTPYTSFVAVSEKVVNKDKKANDVSQPLPLPSGVSELAIGEYTNGSEPTITILLPIVFCVFFVNYFLQRRKI